MYVIKLKVLKLLVCLSSMFVQFFSFKKIISKAGSRHRNELNIEQYFFNVQHIKQI